MLNEIDLSRADLNLLILFDAVLKQRHVGRAAKTLNLTPSAVSHGLGRLRRLLNDPLFLRTPKGVVPTARAIELAESIADVLARARCIIASAEPFDPGRSTRRFTIGAPDGISAVILRPLLASLRREARGITLGIRDLLPQGGARSPAQAWEAALSSLEGRAMDIAVLPLSDAPARFTVRTLFEEDFIIAMRSGHPFARKPTLDRFCEMRHLLVSLAGDAFGFVDEVLSRQGRSRCIALTVPNFMMAMAMIADTDLIAALPRQLAARHARRFALVSREPPLALPPFRISAIVPEVALMDAGVAWLFDTLEHTMRAERTSPGDRPQPTRHVGRPKRTARR